MLSDILDVHTLHVAASIKVILQWMPQSTYTMNVHYSKRLEYS